MYAEAAGRLGAELGGDLYQDLRRLAGAYLRRERRAHTLQPTALVNEALVRLLQDGSLKSVGRADLTRAAARAMRHVLVDHARRRGALKRRPDPGEPSACADSLEPAPTLDMLALDEALQRLERMDPQLLSIVELRFFGGLTEEQTALHLGLSTRTVTRAWRFARLWLLNELREQP